MEQATHTAGAEQDTRAVLVTNISPSSNEKAVSDFFSFCGRINSLNLRATADGSNEALIVFESDSAAKTALLLSNALIGDRPISVAPYTEALPAPVAVEGQPQPEITQRVHAVPDDQRSKTSVIASMVAAGYVLGADAIHKARDYDERHMISLQLKVGAEQLKAKANQIDKQLHITENAVKAKQVIEDTAKDIDDKLKITEKVEAAVITAKAGATVVAARAQESETVQKGIHVAKSGIASVTSTFNQIREESQKAIEEKKRQKEADHAEQAAAAPAAAAAVATPEAEASAPPSQ